MSWRKWANFCVFFFIVFLFEAVNPWHLSTIFALKFFWCGLMGDFRVFSCFFNSEKGGQTRCRHFFHFFSSVLRFFHFCHFKFFIFLTTAHRPPPSFVRVIFQKKGFSRFPLPSKRGLKILIYCFLALSISALSTLTTAYCKKNVFSNLCSSTLFLKFGHFNPTSRHLESHFDAKNGFIFYPFVRYFV